MKNVIVHGFAADVVHTEIVQTSADVSFTDAINQAVCIVVDLFGDQIDSPYDLTLIVTSSDV